MAIAEEVGSAQWVDFNDDTNSGSASDGIGDSEIDTEPHTGLFEGLSSGTHYAQITPNDDGSVTVKISQSASASTAVQLSINVPSVTPVEVDVAGTTLDTSTTPNKLSILVGQAFDASINLPDGATATNSTWSINGGSPIYDFDATQGLPPTSWSPSNETNNNGTTHCYFTQGTIVEDGGIAVTVTCGTHFNFPAGTLPAAGLDVSASKDLYVCAPGITHFKPTIGSIIWSPGGNPATYGTVSLGGLTTKVGGYACGLDWTDTEVTTPDIYTDSGADNGKWSMFQLYVPESDLEFENGQGFHTVFDFGATPLRQPARSALVASSGLTVADCNIPYGGLKFSADGIPHGNADSPSAPVTDIWVQDSQGNAMGLCYVSIYEAFTDTLMYMPPEADNGDSIWVPLSMFSWNVGWSLREDNAGYWTADTGYPNPILNNAPADDPHLTPPAPTSTYPTWDYVVGNAQGHITVTDGNGDYIPMYSQN